MSSKGILLNEAYFLLTAGYGTAKGSPLVWSMPYSCPEFLATQKDLHTWFSSCATAERSQGDPVLVFGRGIAKALQCFANEIWSNGSEHSHKSIDDMVGSPDKARVLDMLVLFKAMDVECSFLHPTRSRPHHPSYNAMNLSQEELDVSHLPIRILSANIQAVKALEPLHTWCQRLSQIPKQRLALLPISIPVEGAQLSHMYSRRWVETWEKITCLLDLLGVYIRFVLFVSTFKFVGNCSHSNICVSIMAWTTYHNGWRIMAWTRDGHSRLLYFSNHQSTNLFEDIFDVQESTTNNT